METRSETGFQIVGIVRVIDWSLILDLGISVMRKLKFFMCAMLCFAIAQTARADVLKDAGFEDNPGSDWITFNNGFQDNNENAQNGIEALQVFGQFTGGDNFNGAFQDIAVDGTDYSVGDTINLEAFAFTPSGDTFPDGSPMNAFIEITWFDPGGLGEFGFGTNVSNLVDWTSPEDTWNQLVTPNAIIPVEAQFIRVKAIVFQPAGNFDGGAVWFDDFQLNTVTIPEPTTFGFLVAGALGMLGFVDRRRRRK